MHETWISKVYELFIRLSNASFPEYYLPNDLTADINGLSRKFKTSNLGHLQEPPYPVAIPERNLKAQAAGTVRI